MNELVPVEDARIRFAVGKDVAAVCKEIVTKTSMFIQRSKKKHVCVEGWQSIAAAWGCTPGIESMQFEDEGVRAKAVLKRDSDGAILSESFGYCGNNEKDSRHAVEGMAQTRAISRVCANKFRFVVVLIDENLSATPAEEMPVEPPVAPAPVESEEQVLEGPLTEAYVFKGWTIGVVKGVKFATNRLELAQALSEITIGAPVRVVVKKFVKDGKTKFRPQSIEVVAESHTQEETQPEEPSDDAG